MSAGAKSVFYYGMSTERATALAAGMSGKALGMTWGGRLLNGAENVYQGISGGKRFGRAFWSVPSAIFAGNAKSGARLLAGGKTPGQIWSKVEKPILDFRKVAYETIFY